MIARRKSEKNTKEKKGSPKGAPLVCPSQSKGEAAPTHTEILVFSSTTSLRLCGVKQRALVHPEKKKTSALAALRAVPKDEHDKR